jgi:hypothetical protein
MKLIYCLMLLLSLQDVWAQSEKRKKKVYQVQITQLSGTKSKGIFYGLDDSSLRIATVKKRDTTFQDIPIVEIDRFFVRRKGVIGTSIAIGALVGAVVGLATYKEPDCEPGSFMCLDFGPGPPMGSGAAIGGLVGAGIGLSLMKKWEIKGDKERLDLLRPQLRQYCFTCN